MRNFVFFVKLHFWMHQEDFHVLAHLLLDFGPMYLLVTRVAFVQDSEVLAQALPVCELEAIVPACRTHDFVAIVWRLYQFCRKKTLLYRITNVFKSILPRDIHLYRAQYTNTNESSVLSHVVTRTRGMALSC